MWRLLPSMAENWEICIQINTGRGVLATQLFEIHFDNDIVVIEVSTASEVFKAKGVVT
jgi:hypothetical protein